MRVLETKLYSFDELTEENKEKAIENLRNTIYGNNNFSEWAIDCCYLFEPKHSELEKVFKGKFWGELNKYTTKKLDVLIENNRKVYFSLGRDRFIDVSNAMTINNDDMFLKWLGVTDRMIREENVYFIIGKDTIDFEENDCQIDFSERDLNILERAKDKFENHCEEILNNIETSIDYNYTDEAIKECIEANDYEFEEDGTQL